MKNMFKSGKIELIDLLPVISLVVLVIIFGITSGGGLFQSFNIQSVIRDSIPVILGGLGVIFVIATGGCDLSIGAVAAVAATVGAYYGSQYGAVWTIIIALLIGLASGIFLGFIVSRCHVSSFMASLALLMGLRGFLNVCNVTWQQVYLPESLLVINQFGPALAITVILTAIIVFLFEKTSFGYYCKGMGENENTMKSIGVNTAKVRHCAFIVSGIMAAIMGLLLISSTGGSSSTLGNFMEMKVQMGVFLGGVLGKLGLPETGDEPMNPFEAAGRDGVGVIEDDRKRCRAGGCVGNLQRKGARRHVSVGELGAFGAEPVFDDAVGDSAAAYFHVIRDGVSP